jgi:ribosome-associated heat shock protein Hsp15
MIRRSGGWFPAFAKPASAGEGRSEKILLQQTIKPLAETDRQRIDRWLWHARIVSTRVAAAGLAASGHIRVNGAKVHASSRMVRAGDVVTVALERHVRVLKVSGFVERRGPARTAQHLYEELT